MLATRFAYADRLDALRETKLEHTREKQELVGSMDHDDWALILPSTESPEVVQTISGSGMPITDVLIKGFEPRPNHPSGGFFGPKACGESFRALPEAHPAYVDPAASLLGGYCVNFGSYRKVGWNPEFRADRLTEERRKYGLVTGIGATQHFCQDLAIGLELGFGGLLDKIAHYRALNGPEHTDFYDGLADVVVGLQAWVRTNVIEARRLAEGESDPEIAGNVRGSLTYMNGRHTAALIGGV